MKQGTPIRLHFEFLFIIHTGISRLVIFENSKLKVNKQSIFFGHAKIRNLSPSEGNIFEHENNHINTTEIQDHFTKFLSVAKGAIYYVATERVIFSPIFVNGKYPRSPVCDLLAVIGSNNGYCCKN